MKVGGEWDGAICLTFQEGFVPLLPSLFSAWVTIRVDMLDNGRNPAESDCNSFSGVFQYPLLTS